MISVAEARERVLAGAEPLAAEWAPLAEAHGRVLSSDLKALRTQPPENVSAMDGYAVRAPEVEVAPALFDLIGEVAAGRPYAGLVGQGQAVRIFTGGVMPAGTDTVVIQENTEAIGNAVRVRSRARRGANVRIAGLDFAAGDTLLRQGQILSDRDLALAAAMNHPTVSVHRRAKVAMFASGDELVMPGTVPGPGQIVCSNVFALAALARSEGAVVIDLGIVPDDLDATRTAALRAREMGADILLTTGGASVGDYDLVQKALTVQGMELAFWRVALRPGRPLLSGRLGSTSILGLPGNPVSAYVCAFLFLVPLLRRLHGRADTTPPPETAILGADLPANDERADYLRAKLERTSDGAMVATPFAIQDSSTVHYLAEADCLIARDPFAPAATSGSRCRILALRP